MPSWKRSGILCGRSRAKQMREGNMNFKDVSITLPAPSRRASDMPHYVRSDISAKPGVELIQLSRNESAIVIQPEWIDAAIEAASASVAYPDPECSLLRQAIAETFC